MVDINTGLFSLVAARCRDALTNAGYEIHAQNDEDVVVDYFRVLRRSIPAQPRVVYLAQTFTCPPDLKPIFDALCHKARIGDDLRPHQHRDCGDATFDDGLLNDWDLHHLHLTTTVKADGHVTRSKAVLFARVTADAFYCLTILPHGRGVKPPWSRQELVDILHENWPTSIAHAALKSAPGLQIIGLAQTYTDEEYARLRKTRINVLTQRADGTIHMPIGGGVSSSGINIPAVRECDRLRLQCLQIDGEVKRRIEQLAADGKCPANAVLDLDITDDHLFGEIANLIINFGPLSLNIVPLK